MQPGPTFADHNEVSFDDHWGGNGRAGCVVAGKSGGFAGEGAVTVRNTAHLNVCAGTDYQCLTGGRNPPNLANIL